jgi:CRISPR-associated endonuclease Cas1
VVTLFGYGIVVRVEHGHLVLIDGLGARRKARFPRVRHDLRRLVVIGSDGMISLAALRWLADQDAAFVMLDRDGSVLATTGPVRPSDARLRRAQSMANQTGHGLRISRELIGQKLAAQEQLVLRKLAAPDAARVIAHARSTLVAASSIGELRQCEARAAYAYWSAWRNVPTTFPTNHLHRVPHHWRTFGARISPLSGSPRLAVNPPNAMLNYLYALLESEARLALSALGLDPGIGLMHMDTPARDSLACDLMEPVRPKVDGFVLDWIMRERLRREWFFEERDGNCRLMGSFAVRLSETAGTWGSAIAPFAEWISRALWSTIRRRSKHLYPPTRLTQTSRREARGTAAKTPERSSARPPSVCRICGASINSGDKYCRVCAVTVSRANLIEAAKAGRVATVSTKAQRCRSAALRRQAAALRAWKPSDKPEWLDENAYREKILPRLGAITVPNVSSALAVSELYATNIRGGKCIPHPRHWLALARLVGIANR